MMASVSSDKRLQLSEEKARNWLNSIDPENYDDLESVLESITNSSIVESSDSESGEEQRLGIRTNKATYATSSRSDAGDDENYHDIKDLPNYKDLTDWDCVKNNFLNILPQSTFSNISVTNASNVVLGNIIKIKGDLIVNIKADNNNYAKSKENENLNEESQERRPDKKAERDEHDGSTAEKENIRQKRSVTSIYRPPCLIVPRTSWLAMDPMSDYNYIQEPVELVIICHTATTSSTEQPKNVGIIRDIQTFHIETRGWDDIGYNFLIGCDGNVYEGRGWGVEGAHTFSFNNRSIGVAFIGCFMRKLPTARALQACKKLLQRGLDEGHLHPDYKLMAHRQCIATESPGSKLFQEIQKWDHFQVTADNELNESDGE